MEHQDSERQEKLYKAETERSRKTIEKKNIESALKMTELKEIRRQLEEQVGLQETASSSRDFSDRCESSGW